jgi:hypothetical protein
MSGLNEIHRQYKFSFVETSRLLNSVRTPLEDLSITEIE